MPQSTEEESLRLAREILDGIEQGAMQAERSLLKASRLARLIRDGHAEEWLDRERDGYAKDGARSEASFFASSRAFEDEKFDVYSGIPELAQRSRVLRLQLEQLRLPDVSGEWAMVALRETRQNIAFVADTIQRYEGVISAVERRIHNYVATVYHALAFSAANQGMFEIARANIDPLLLDAAPDLVRKLDYATSSLEDGHPEAVSSATNSIRRLLSTFADVVFPPQEGPRIDPADGREVQVGSGQYLNRIKGFIDDNCASESRRRNLKQRITFINERTSAGVHAEVTREEARFILLNAYILMGEILALNPGGASSTAENLIT